MTDPDHTKPDVTELYSAGLFASALSYFGIVALVALGLGITEGGPSGAAVVFLFGLFLAAIPAAIIAVLITAPLGCLLGVLFRDRLPPTQWFGAITGASVAIIVLLGFQLMTLSDRDSAPDPIELGFWVCAIGICAASGWLAQRKVLVWPADDEDVASDAFE